ncbi:MAG: hypothetical protein C5B52_15435 [Bacteroidetes bacterium]|nr:MAG: hypothetical protein C5B52_15435 [Bacteroidota bacterium]
MKKLLWVFGVLLFSNCQKDCPQPAATLPEVSTITISDIKDTSCTAYGALLKIGTTNISDYGFCWSVNENPTISNFKNSNGSVSEVKSYSNTITGLIPDQNYFVRAYATNSVGIAYGDQLTFKTSKNKYTSGLIAYYPFNNNINDESGNNNNGTAYGGTFTSDRKGNANSAYHFSGSNYILINNSFSLSSISDSFSVSAWIYNEGQGVSLICKSPYNGTSMQFRVYVDSKIFFANYHKSADFDFTLNPTSEWKHIVITSDGTTAKYYLNGVLTSSISLTDATNAGDNSSDLYIGADTHGVVEFYNGSLDEIRIYNRVLTESEIVGIYNL